MAIARNRMTRVGVMALAILFTGDGAPPTEFRIFAAGLNTTRNGNYLFDAKAATDVMAAYQAHGTDVMVDLEHLSLNEESRSYDPDARGWCKLELRGGELWAVGVSWTPDGEMRLREKRQRYISPVFKFSEKTRRVERVLNVAITALPATDHLEPLVAANQLSGGDNTMSPEQLAAIAEALGLGGDANVEDVIATISAMVKKLTDAANGDGDPEDKAEPPEGTPAAAAEAAPPVVAAARIRIAARALAKLSGKRDIGEVVSEVEAWHASHLELETSRAKLAQDRATLEGSERRRLVGDLVKLGAEIPATAWSDDAGTKPAEPWASMPIVALRERVAKLTGAKGGTVTRINPRPVPVAADRGGQIVSVNGESVELTGSEVAACKAAGATVEAYAANKLIRTRARAAQSS